MWTEPSETVVEADASPVSPREAGEKPRLVVGVTSDQTCLVLKGRLRALRLAGFEVTLIASPGELLSRIAEEEGVVAVALPMRRGIAPMADLISFFALWRALAKLRPTITDFSTPKAGLLGNVVAWMLQVPCRVYTLRGLKLEGLRGWKQRLLLESERMAGKCAHLVLCNSASLRSEALGLRVAVEEKLRLLGDGSSGGVDTKEFSPGASDARGKLGIGEDDYVVGFVGRLTRDKGIPELLEAFEEILRAEPRCWLLLVGWFDSSEDALDQRWRTHIAAHPRIRCTGFVVDTVPYYQAMDLFVLPTRREGFPNVALEAAACGLPVITTDSTGARDAVLPGITGRVIPVGNSGVIAEAVVGLLRDERLRRQMGMAGRRWVTERYSRERMLELMVEFYRGLMRSA